MACRADKFIWAVRLAKTRSKAAEVIAKGKVLINDQTIKPSKELKPGDQITLLINGARLNYRIMALLEKRVGAKLVSEYLQDTTSPEELERLRQYRLAQQAYRENGEGKPTKKDRRSLDDFLNSWD